MKKQKLPKPYEVWSVERVESEFGVSRDVQYPFADPDFATEQEQRVYRGPLRIEGNFESSKKQDWSPYNIVVDGDLVVTGAIDWQDHGSGCFVLVTGNVTAKALHLKGCPNFVVRGDLRVEHGIVGHYGDDGGYLAVRGRTHTPFVVNTLYFTMSFGTSPSGLVLSDEDDIDCPVDFEGSELQKAVLRTFVDRDGEVDSEKLQRALLRGKPILASGVAPVWQETLALIATLDAETTTELRLASTKLRELPSDLARFRNLRHLSLAGNRLAVLPPELGQLTTLETLDLSAMGLRHLPDEIGNLRSLRTLSLADNPLESLPDSLGNLTELRELSVGGVQCELPATLASLQKLEKLDLSYRGAEPLRDIPDEDAPPPQASRIPAVVFTLRALRTLNLNMAWIEEVPDQLLDLQALEELDLGSSLGGLAALPDLARLPNLHTLGFDGSSGNTRHDPKPSLLTGVWKIRTLRSLTLSRWKTLERLPEHAFEHLQGLETLDLSFNAITDLPASFFALKHLRTVRLRMTKLGPNVLARLAKTFPAGVRFDLRDIEVGAAASSAPSWKKVRRLVQRATEARDPELQCELYEKALAGCKPGATYTAYDELYTHYGLMLALGKRASGETSKASRQALVQRCIEVAQRALELTPSMIWHFTDEGEFHQEVTRQACNALAWYGMEAATSHAELERALETIERGLAMARHADDYLRDTQARILVKLGRLEDAYRVVERVLRADPSASDFQDWKKDPAYRAWVLQPG